MIKMIAAAHRVVHVELEPRMSLEEATQAVVDQLEAVDIHPEYGESWPTNYTYSIQLLRIEYKSNYEEAPTKYAIFNVWRLG